MDQLIIFDTTMRDGEQSPGASMTKDEKVRIGKQLEKMRVDVIEAGFAAASHGDFDAIHAVASAIKDSIVCSLARAQTADIQKAGDAIKPAARGRIHTFIATSPIHMQHKLRMSPDQVLVAAIDAVKFARTLCEDVEFSAEDAVRSDMDFLCRVFEAVIKAGAKTINVPDTVGYSTPELWAERFRTLIERVPNADKVVWSTHCHNDLGMAVANSLAAVKAGARQVECTINGLGERAGNAALEEIVMALRTRKDYFGVETRIDATQIVPASKLVSTITGYPVQPNKAVVGANAFAHESGIHQDGVLKHRETYEIMRAQDVGWHNNRLSLGKLSGRSAFRDRLKTLGIELESEVALNAAFQKFMLFPAAHLQLGLLSGFVMALGTRLTREEREKARIRNMFAGYVSDDVVNMLISSGQKLDMGGQSMHISVLFSDIRNFTTITEKLSAHETVEFLNVYFERVINVIRAEGGRIDKFIGDAVMAEFGVPYAFPDHAARALRAAVAMRNIAEDFKNWMHNRFPDLDLPEFGIGIGIHTGDAVVGNLGSAHRMEFTAIGDTVNVASRLESETKNLRYVIVASAQTVHAAGAGVVTGRHETIAVKGRSEPVEVYEVIDFKS